MLAGDDGGIGGVGGGWTYVGERVGAVEVGADDALFLDAAEEVFGVRVGEGGHLGGVCWWRCLVIEELFLGGSDVFVRECIGEE